MAARHGYYKMPRNLHSFLSLSLVGWFLMGGVQMFYVDDLYAWGKVGRHSEWAHVMTDDLTPAGREKLHEFARRLGLRRAWFQDDPMHPHYDVTANKRALAIRLGAQAVTSAELVRRCSRVFRKEE